MWIFPLQLLLYRHNKLKTKNNLEKSSVLVDFMTKSQQHIM